MGTCSFDVSSKSVHGRKQHDDERWSGTGICKILTGTEMNSGLSMNFTTVVRFKGYSSAPFAYISGHKLIG